MKIMKLSEAIEHVLFEFELSHILDTGEIIQPVIYSQPNFVYRNKRIFDTTSESLVFSTHESEEAIENTIENTIDWFCWSKMATKLEISEIAENFNLDTPVPKRRIKHFNRDGSIYPITTEELRKISRDFCIEIGLFNKIAQILSIYKAGVNANAADQNQTAIS